MVQQAFTYENLNAWTCGTISQRNWLLEEAWIWIHWFWAFNFDDVCTSSHVEDFHNLSVLQKIIYGPAVVLSLPMCNLDSRGSAHGPSTSCQYVPSHWLKRISIPTQNFTSTHEVIYSLLVYATFFSQLSSMTVEAGCVRISCSAKGYGQIPNRFCSRISFEEPNSSLLILCR